MRRVAEPFPDPLTGGSQRAHRFRLSLLAPGQLTGRGLRLGGRLVDTCLEFAMAAGYQRMRLWTTDPLTVARHIYLRRGFQLIEEEPQHTFGADLVGQTYLRNFAPAGLTPAANR
jgi:GNAT superfamily N-acetyltransferase